MKGLFFGLTTIDIQYFVDEFPKPNTKIKTLAPEILVGGPATNAAITFSHLGGKADLFSSFGTNSFKSFLEEDLNRFGVSHNDLTPEENCAPVLASVVTSKENGDRTIFTNNPSDLNELVDVDKIFAENKFSVVMLDGFYLGSAIEIAFEAKKREIPVVLDGGSWKDGLERLLPFIDYAICSEKFMPPWCKSSNEVFEYLDEKGIQFKAITRGENSILYNNGSGIKELPVLSVAAADTLGAGDIFHGAFAYQISRLTQFVPALKKAAEVATLSCQFPGTRVWMQ